MSEMPLPKRKPLPPVEQWPWYASPYMWAFIFGVVFLTLIRPCTRHVPDPLPRLGDVPAWLAPVDPAPEGTSLLTVWDPACEVCMETLEGVADAHRELSRANTPVEVYIAYPRGVDIGPAQDRLAYEPNTHFYAVEIGEDWQEGSLSKATLSGDPLPEDIDAFIALGTVWILDPSGAIRGPLRAQTTDHRSELFHRTQHVIYDASDDSSHSP